MKPIFCATGSNRNSNLSWLPLGILLLISLTGCGTTSHVVAPCPKLPSPPPTLMEPAESEAARARLLMELERR
jgi:hypothetical protein